VFCLELEGDGEGLHGYLIKDRISSANATNKVMVSTHGSGSMKVLVSVNVQAAAVIANLILFTVVFTCNLGHVLIGRCRL
jgi:hypothetical protein